MTLLRRSSLRHLLHHRWQAALSVLGVGLGVGVVLAVDVAVGSARTGFTVSTEMVTGRATHAVTGGPSGLSDSAYGVIRAAPGIAAAAPVVEGWAVAGDRVLRVLGVDPFAEGAFRRYGAEDRTGPAATLLIGVRAGFLSRATADALGVEEGDWLRLEVQGQPDSVRVAAILEPRDEAARLGLRDLLLVDVGTAQALLDRSGLDRVDVIARSTNPVAVAVRSLPPGVSIRDADARAGDLREMTQAFDLNLRALSLLALIFGLFLIYNSVTFSVVQRRTLLGTLRALGATRGQVFGLVQSEALVLGLAGSVLGVGLGIVLGGGLVRLVTRTIEDLYFVLAVRELIIPPSILVKGVVLGVGGTFLAASPPAFEAAATQPRSALLRSELEAGLRRRLPALSLAGALFLALGLVVLATGSNVQTSFAGLFGVILGAALLTPGTMVLLMHGLRPLAGSAFGVLGRMAAGGVTAGLSRTAPAVAALTIAVAVAIGVGAMIGSFRGSVSTWLDRTLSADVYVSPLRSGPSDGARIAPLAVDRLGRDPAVAEVRRYRRGPVPWRDGDGTVDLMAIAVDSRLRGQIDLLEGDMAEAWAGFAAGRTVLVSEPFGFRHGLGPADTLRLRTDRGDVSLPVAGVFRDYGTDRGMVMMSYAGYRRLWDDSAVTAVALILRPGSDDAATAGRLRQATAAVQPLSIRSDRALRDASLDVFDRTFAITQVLRLLALIVAFVAILSALMALQLERRRELGVLRANGLTPGQVWGLVASQTGLMGAAAGIMAVPLGVLLAVLMTEFVNRRSFGWSMDLAVSPTLLLQSLGIALAASLLAGLYPAWRMARTSPAEALRGE